MGSGDRLSRVCKDCSYGAAITFKNPPVRPAPYKGPRCHTHHKLRLREEKEENHERRVMAKYGFARGQYSELYKAQGGVCYICRRAKGASKKLSVDHDHESGYVRGLLCNPCNKFLGHIRDDTDAALRVYTYLAYPPAFSSIGYVKPEVNENE